MFTPHETCSPHRPSELLAQRTYSPYLRPRIGEIEQPHALAVFGTKHHATESLFAGLRGAVSTGAQVDKAVQQGGAWRQVRRRSEHECGVTALVPAAATFSEARFEDCSVI